jgi:hypothetical protein
MTPMRRPIHYRRSGLHIVGFLLLVWTAWPMCAQTNPDAEACKGSTVDLQGTDFAQKSRAFLSELQSAVKAADKAKVGAMISYPLLVIRGERKTHIRTKAEFLSHYDAILDAHIRQAIARQSAKCLFGNYQGAMIGDGEVWFREKLNGTMKIVTVNLTAGSQ